MPRYNVTFSGDYCVMTATSVEVFSDDHDYIEECAVVMLKEYHGLDPYNHGLGLDTIEELD